MYVIDYEKADEDGSIDNDGAALDEEYGSSLVEEGVSIGVPESGTKDVEEVQRAVKSASIL